MLSMAGHPITAISSDAMYLLYIKAAAAVPTAASLCSTKDNASQTRACRLANATQPGGDLTAAFRRCPTHAAAMDP